MHLVSSITYMSVGKFGNACYNPMPTRAAHIYKALTYSLFSIGQPVKSHAPRSLALGHSSSFYHASSPETFDSRHLVPALLIPQKIGPACLLPSSPFSLSQLLTLLVPRKPALAYPPLRPGETNFTVNWFSYILH